MSRINVKTPSELALMVNAGRLLAAALELVREAVRPLVTTESLDRLAEDYIVSHGGTPAFKGYRGYPCALCTSINEQVVHGIPGPRRLRHGDLLSIDLGVCLEGYLADAAITVEVGRCSPQAKRLRDATKEALDAALSLIRPGVRVREISRAVQDVAESHGYSVVRDYTGHGIGSKLHEEPQVPNFVRPASGPDSPALPEGATIAVEPMFNAGTHKTKVLADGWTVVTADGELSAHFEHTVAVGKNGAKVLTLPQAGCNTGF